MLGFGGQIRRRRICLGTRSPGYSGNARTPGWTLWPAYLPEPIQMPRESSMVAILGGEGGIDGLSWGQDTDTVRGDGMRGMRHGMPECPHNAEYRERGNVFGGECYSSYAREAKLLKKRRDSRRGPAPRMPVRQGGRLALGGDVPSWLWGTFVGSC